MSQVTPQTLQTFLNSLPLRILRRFAAKHKTKYNLELTPRRPQLIDEILTKIPVNVIVEELYDKYCDAGNVTLFLFLTQKSKESGITPSKVMNILKDSSFMNLIKSPLSEKPLPRNIKLRDESIFINYEYLGRPLFYRDPQTRDLKEVHPLEVTCSVFHIDSGLLEVRTRNKKSR